MQFFVARAFVVLSCALLSALSFASSAEAQTMVRLHTTQGPMDIRLLDSEAPNTVANFLGYVSRGDYANSLIHRSAWTPATQSTATAPFVVQGGGIRWPDGPDVACCSALAAVPARPAISNEFSATRSNIRGSVAMAKVGGQPNSATNQWFVNMGNNTSLDTNNGGFTVFGRLTVPGLELADRISRLKRLNITGTVWPLGELPVQNWQGGLPTRSQMVLVTNATEVPPPATENDRIFNYLEAKYPTYLAPVATAAGDALGYNYRYYAQYNVYLAIGNGRVGYYAPSVADEFVDVGPVDYWTTIATTEGY